MSTEVLKQESIKTVSSRALLSFIEVTYNNTIYKFVNNPVNVSGYTASSFSFVLPKKQGSYEYATQLVISNIDREITAMVRSTLGTPIPVSLWLAFSDTPLVPEIGKFELEMINANITAETITLNVSKPNILEYQLGGNTMNTTDFPGLGYA